jgi:hypothetical protein
MWWWSSPRRMPEALVRGSRAWSEWRLQRRRGDQNKKTGGVRYDSGINFERATRRGHGGGRQEMRQKAANWPPTRIHESQTPIRTRSRTW